MSVETRKVKRQLSFQPTTQEFKYKRHQAPERKVSDGSNLTDTSDSFSGSSFSQESVYSAPPGFGSGQQKFATPVSNKFVSVMSPGQVSMQFAPGHAQPEVAKADAFGNYLNDFYSQMSSQQQTHMNYVNNFAPSPFAFNEDQADLDRFRAFGMESSPYAGNSDTEEGLQTCPVKPQKLDFGSMGSSRNLFGSSKREPLQDQTNSQNSSFTSSGSSELNSFFGQMQSSAQPVKENFINFGSFKPQQERKMEDIPAPFVVTQTKKLYEGKISQPGPRSVMPKKVNEYREKRLAPPSSRTPVSKPSASQSMFRRQQIQLKKELEDSPRSKKCYNSFLQRLKEHEKKGFEFTIFEVLQNIWNDPNKIHWKILMDLADFAKREGKYGDSRVLYKVVSRIQPYAYQGWLEYAKMEEELGNTKKCRKILEAGLKFCHLNENLFVKKIKVEEKSQEYTAIRKSLAKFKKNTNNGCKILIEGALFEARIGNISSARSVLKYLMKGQKSYALVYHEAS